ncbi:hypothetical protein N7523_006531 [Penicillium sp. IBT 18751x]|nr:hypothetical protein N7523_006531 [Penicillium sp. IBT 18751x]
MITAYQTRKKTQQLRATGERIMNRKVPRTQDNRPRRAHGPTGQTATDHRPAGPTSPDPQSTGVRGQQPTNQYPLTSGQTPVETTELSHHDRCDTPEFPEVSWEHVESQGWTQYGSWNTIDSPELSEYSQDQSHEFQDADEAALETQEIPETPPLSSGTPQEGPGTPQESPECTREGQIAGIRHQLHNIACELTNAKDPHGITQKLLEECATLTDEQIEEFLTTSQKSDEIEDALQGKQHTRKFKNYSKNGQH